jgi:hypothetical protein
MELGSVTLKINNQQESKQSTEILMYAAIGCILRHDFQWISNVSATKDGFFFD